MHCRNISYYSICKYFDTGAKRQVKSLGLILETSFLFLTASSLEFPPYLVLSPYDSSGPYLGCYVVLGKEVGSVPAMLHAYEFGGYICRSISCHC